MKAMDALAEHRQRYVSRLAAGFLARFHLILIFLATAGAAVLASRLLYGAGLDQVALRYALAVLLAYALFFALVRTWIFYVTDVRSREARLDVPRGGSEHGTAFQPGRAVSGGRGGSAQWDDGVRVVRSIAELGGSKPGGSASGGSRGSQGIDDGIVLVFVLVILAGVLGGAAVYLTWRAPIILPEAAFAALLAAGLIGAVRRDEARGWTRGVLRATFVPFLLVLVASALAGWAVQRADPPVVSSSAITVAGAQT
jgi:hypothetical protein